MEGQGGNVVGIVILAIAVAMVIIGLKGSQHALFPQLFGTTGTNTPSYAGGLAPAPVQGPAIMPPNKDGSCNYGYIIFPDKKCHKLIPIAN
jgi:hypothetical protein